MHEQFQQTLDEINGKLVAKGAQKAWKATKAGAKKVGGALKDSGSRAAVTAQNAIVAGIAAPVGIKAADKLYGRKPQNKDRKYTQAEVAALITAAKKNEDFQLTEEDIVGKIKANLRDFAKTESEAYFKAQEAADKITAEYNKTQNEQSLKHPLLSSVKWGVKRFGQIFLTMLFGLLIIAYYSGKVTNARVFISTVIKEVGPNIAKECLLLLGIVGAVNTVRSLFHQNESLQERLQYDLQLLEDKTKKEESGLKKVAKGAGAGAASGAAIGGGLGAGMAGGLAHKAATTLGATGKRGVGKIIRRGVTGAAGAAGGLYGGVTGGIKGLVGGAAVAGIAHAVHKAKQKKKTNESIESLKEAVDKLKEVGKRSAKAKEILAGSPAVKKAMKSAAIKGGIKGAAITAGLGAAAYGIHKYNQNNKY